MPKIIPPARTPETGLVAKVRKFVTLKRQIDDLSKEQSVIKTELSDLVDETGEPDDKGHLWLPLPEEVDGYRSLQRQKRISQRLDAEAAENLLKAKGLDTRCYTQMPVLQEDEVMACLYEGLLTEEEIDLMYPKSITWAFVPSKS